MVLGGSLGARALNTLLPEAIRSLPAGVGVDVWHQTGRQHYETTVALYHRCGVPADRVMPYIEDMAEAYTWADLVLCRAGALTVSEISVIGVASILVPYPHAVDDHQTVNARYLCDAGGAVLIPESELCIGVLVDQLGGFCRQRGRLVEMAAASQRCAFPGATAAIGRLCMEVVDA
jgi:UDP-N-acetylglucosamine--N-acetylmuramyl-(pentapeptide) pyrophosphoryl-undecaprenol N-acetylglucosamine transferase